MGWFPRVNYLEADGLIRTMQTPLYDLVTEVDHCIELRLDITKVKGQAVTDWQRQEWENTIQKNFTWLMFKPWRKSFNYHIPLSQREMLIHGIGAHVWPNDRWIPRTPRSGQILFPEEASVDFQEQGEYFMLRDFVTGVNAYNFIRNEKAAKARGWIPDNVWKSLANAMRKNQRTVAWAQVEELRRRYRNGDLGAWGTAQVGIWINWLFVKEYDAVGGKQYSLYGVDELTDVGTKDGGYLFKKRFNFEEWPLVLYNYDLGQGDIHSVRGLGWRTKDFFELSNRVNNMMAVQILIGGFPMVKQTQPTIDPDKFKLMRLGALSMIPYGADFGTFQFPPLNNSGIAFQSHMRDTLEKNNQSAMAGTPEPKDRETKYSYMLRANQQAQVSNGLQSSYESSLQQTYEKLYRGVITTTNGSEPYQKMAQEFHDRCIEEGVPEEALTEKAIGELNENTSAGQGSAAIRLQAIQLLLNSPVYTNASDEKKIVIERDLVASTLGGASVDRYARSVSDANLPDTDESFAVQENNGLASGGDAMVGEGQHDETHAQVHLQKGMEIMQMCEQKQIDPQQALTGLQKLLEHAGQHLAKLGAVNRKDMKPLVDQWRQLAQYMNKLQSEVQSQQEQPDQQQQMSEDFQLGLMKLQQDDQLKNKKADADIARKFRKDAFQERLADSKTASSIAMASTKNRSQIGMKAAQTGTDLAMQGAKHNQQMLQTQQKHAQQMANNGTNLNNAV
jgi:hypothetical protein